MDFLVEITPSAESDIDEAVRWIVEHGSIAAASRWYAGLLDRVAGLSRMPARFGLAFENQFFEPGELRQFTYYSHRIIYAIEGDRVQILHVRHASQQGLEQDEL